MLFSQPRLLFSFSLFHYFLVVEASALTGSVATEPVRVGGVQKKPTSAHVCVGFFFLFNMGLNHYIGSCLNYRLLFLLQRHHSILEVLLCSTVCFPPSFFLACACVHSLQNHLHFSCSCVFRFYGTLPESSITITTQE